MSKPALPLPVWATVTNYTTGPDIGSPTKIQPIAGEFAEGFHRNGRPPAQKVNWTLNKLGEWIVWGDQFWLNGETGGFWAPTNPIGIGGSGLEVSANFNMNGSGVFAVQATVAGATFLCPVIIDNVTGLTVVQGSQFLGVAQFFDGINANEVSVSTIGLFVGVTGTHLGNGIAGLQCEDIATFQDEIILTSTGRIRERIVQAPNADHTFAATDGTVIVAGVAITAHTWTLNDAAAQGATLRLVNYSTSIMTLQNQGLAPLLFVPSSQLPAASGAAPGILNLLWVSNGLYTGWSKF